MEPQWLFKGTEEEEGACDVPSKAQRERTAAVCLDHFPRATEEEKGRERLALQGTHSVKANVSFNHVADKSIFLFGVVVPVGAQRQDWRPRRSPLSVLLEL